MISIVTINKGGQIKTEKIKKVNINELYKKAKLRKNDKFEKRNTWKLEKGWVSIYAKNDGRAGSENKYDLPPPIDKDLYFGILVIIKHKNKIPKNEEVVNFTKEEWLKVYEKCMGGFEDLENTSDEEEEEEEIPAHLKTKSGYMKDGFVVDDDEDEEDCEDDGEDDDEDEDCQSEEDDADSEDDEHIGSDIEEYDGSDTESNGKEIKSKSNNKEDDIDVLDDIGSELSEEDYDYN